MKKNHVFATLLILLILTMGVSCRKYFERMNTNTKRVGDADATPESLFTYAQKNLSDFMATPNVNSNVFRFFAQYWTNPQYTQEPQFNMVQRSIPDNIYLRIYRDVLSNLKAARETLQQQEPGARAKLGMIQVLEVYAYAFAVEIWGDIPYTEALDINNVSPRYDDGKTVYLDLVRRLDEAITNLEAGGASMGAADLVYMGNTEKWKKFAHSLKLRMALMLCKTDNTKAKTMLQNCNSSSCFTSQDDSYIFRYLASNPNTNPAYADQILSNRNEMVGTTTLIDTMKGLKDPRLKFYFNTKDNHDSSSRANANDTLFKGFPYAQQGSGANGFSRPNIDRVYAPTADGILMDYAEVQFYLAEACCRGLLTNGTTTCEYMKKGIEASIKYWVGIDTAGMGAYVGQATKNMATTCSTSSTNGNGFPRELAFQMWVALYNRGYEGWNVWRRFGHFPNFFGDSTATNSGGFSLVGVGDGKTANFSIDSTGIPFRMSYPINEQTRNGANLNEAISRIGGNALTTKLFFFK